MTNLSWKTAQQRTKISTPVAYLAKQGLLTGSMLDYGCGRGHDATMFNMAMFDPYWYPYWYNLVHSYDTIVCIYVLNTIPEQAERDNVIVRLYELLKPGGKAYIAVRNDVQSDGYTSKGTWQGNIQLQLPLIHSTKQYKMYLLTADGR